MNLFENGKLNEKLNENEKIERDIFLSKLNFGLNLLNEARYKGYKLSSLNVKNDNIVFSNNNKEEVISIKKLVSILASDNSETSEHIQMTRTSETSDLPKNNKLTTMPIDTTTSDLELEQNNILKNPDYSDTSPMEFNSRSDKFSETSVIDGRSDTSVIKSRSDKYSDTSVIINQDGGNYNLTSDTLDMISDLKQRKSNKTETKLDMGIFKKKTQTGGSVDSLKKKMMNAGINSNSSTSSICE